MLRVEKSQHEILLNPPVLVHPVLRFGQGDLVKLVFDGTPVIEMQYLSSERAVQLVKSGRKDFVPAHPAERV